MRAVALHLPCGQHGAGHPLGALAAPAVVRLGQAEQAAGLGDAGVLPWREGGEEGDIVRTEGWRCRGKLNFTWHPRLWVQTLVRSQLCSAEC